MECGFGSVLSRVGCSLSRLEFHYSSDKKSLRARRGPSSDTKSRSRSGTGTGRKTRQREGGGGGGVRSRV